jgi:hypothetical protein
LGSASIFDPALPPNFSPITNTVLGEKLEVSRKPASTTSFGLLASLFLALSKGLLKLWKKFEELRGRVDVAESGREIDFNFLCFVDEGGEPWMRGRRVLGESAREGGRQRWRILLKSGCGEAGWKRRR